MGVGLLGVRDVYGHFFQSPSAGGTQENDEAIADGCSAEVLEPRCGA